MGEVVEVDIFVSFDDFLINILYIKIPKNHNKIQTKIKSNGEKTIKSGFSYHFSFGPILIYLYVYI